MFTMPPVPQTDQVIRVDGRLVRLSHKNMFSNDDVRWLEFIRIKSDGQGFYRKDDSDGSIVAHDVTRLWQIREGR